MTHKNSSELDRAVEAHRASQPVQAGLPLPLAPGAEPAEILGPVAKGPGRPAGSPNLRTEELARIYRGRHGDPLEIATAIGAKNVLDGQVVQELARVWGCTRLEAVKLWAAVNADANRYHHQQMPRAVILPPGAPGGERVFLEIEGEYREVPTAGGEDEAGEQPGEQAGERQGVAA